MLSLTFGRRDLVAASTFERARGAKVEWGNFSGSRNRRLMIMPGKVWPSVLHRRPVAPQVGKPSSVDRCVVRMQGEELAEGREAGAGAIEGIVPRQHQLVLVEKGVPMKPGHWNG
jgi:hypothetical protein